MNMVVVNWSPRANHAGKDAHHLTLHIVLGHPGRDSNRLDALLSYAAKTNRRLGPPSTPGRTFELTPHPMFAQDFFTVMNRDQLFRG
jgi:hypothetical protein